MLSILPKVVRLSLCATLACSFALPVLADQKATADDGRTVVLKANGQWEYSNNDRFATGADGTRVRLKDNGQWEFIGNAPAKTETQVTTQALDVRLGDVIAESYKEKVGKNTRYVSQTTFDLQINVSGYSKQAIEPKLSRFNLIQITDTKGNHYPILSITPQPQSMEPGKSYTVQIRADGTPAGQVALMIKALNVTVDKGVFGTPTDLTFTRQVDEVKKVKRQTPF